ncbi:MAG: NifU family protein [Nitrospinae bacterium]|nr:NifU family protein [Nitrospinota bacterium]
MGKFTEWLKGFMDSSGSDKDSSSPVTPAKDETVREFHVDRFQNTPNPDAGQFLMNKKLIASGTKTFSSAESAQGNAMAEAIFKVFGVESVYIKQNFVTVTKSSTVDWSGIIEPIRGAIEKNVAFYDKSDEEDQPAKKTDDLLEAVNVEDFPSFSDERKAEIIEAMLDHSIRPALANDGGGIEVIGVEGNTVKIHYQGACGTCPSASAGTLQYIENFLQETLSPTLKIQNT